MTMDNRDILDISNGTFNVDVRSCGRHLYVSVHKITGRHIFSWFKNLMVRKVINRAPWCSLNMSFLWNMLPHCGFGVVVYTVIFCRLLIMTRGLQGHHLHAKNGCVSNGTTNVDVQASGIHLFLSIPKITGCHFFYLRVKRCSIAPLFSCKQHTIHVSHLGLKGPFGTRSVCS